MRSSRSIIKSLSLSLSLSLMQMCQCTFINFCQSHHLRDLISNRVQICSVVDVMRQGVSMHLETAN